MSYREDSKSLRLSTIRLIRPEQAETLNVKINRRIRQLGQIMVHNELDKPPDPFAKDLTRQLLEINFASKDIVGIFLLFQQVDVFVEDFCKQLEAL